MTFDTRSHHPRTSVPVIPLSRARAAAIARHQPDRRHQMRTAGFGLLLVAAAAIAAASVHIAMPWPPAGTTRTEAPPATPEPAAIAGLGAGEAATLARATLLALHEANRSGNYAVLHDRAAPPFQEANAPDDLARIFAAQRAAGLDLSVAANEAPRWDAAPTVGPDGHLRMRGHYDTPGHMLRFALQFAPVVRHWRLYEIGVVAEPKQARSGG